MPVLAFYGSYAKKARAFDFDCYVLFVRLISFLSISPFSFKLSQVESEILSNTLSYFGKTFLQHYPGGGVVVVIVVVTELSF